MFWSPPTYQQIEICRKSLKEFTSEKRLIIKKKLQVKSNSNLKNLLTIHFRKNSQCTIIKKGALIVVYVEDKKVLVSLKKQNFSGCISVEHSFPNHLLVFATCIKTSDVIFDVMLHVTPWDYFFFFCGGSAILLF